MGLLGNISWKDFLRVARKLGYEMARKKGSHIRLRCEGNPRRKPLSLPAHNILKPGLLRRLIRDAGLTVDEFIKILSE